MKIRKLALAMLALCPLCAWADEESRVTVARSDGSVEIVKSGSAAGKPGKSGDTLERGDRLVVGDKSAALLQWSNGSMVKLHPNTAIGLAGVSFDLERKMESTLLDLEKGGVFVKSQVPDHLFNEFKVRMGGLELRTQIAEFALDRDAEKKSFTAAALVGRLVTDVANDRVRIEEGQQATVVAGAKPAPDAAKPMPDTSRQSLAKLSADMGGSLRSDEVKAGPDGKLVAKIGGVGCRRGSAPYKVKFKALSAGGSGRIKSYGWSFGDGESAAGSDADHTFTMGQYVVVLRVEDENGQKASAQMSILVEADCGC